MNKKRQVTELYRHFDGEGRLLYIGVSLSAARRLSQHMYKSEWAADITDIKVERFPTRQEALDAERNAIINEKPIWNIVYRKSELSVKPVKNKRRKWYACAAEDISRATVALKNILFMSNDVAIDEEVLSCKCAYISVLIAFDVEHDVEHIVSLYNSICENFTGYLFECVQIHEERIYEGIVLRMYVPGRAEAIFSLERFDEEYEGEYHADISLAISEYAKVFSSIIDLDAVAHKFYDKY
ncbi:GIY-YIG nuclease family protein [Aeromonas veronii]|uniref:hypothetical protein n=1 Tax=Aeromonas veronii TaxID=654 RepID=UPI0018F2793C|nr:hypothetical protein [Aeromonas veronii]MBJ7591525.1 hypothetical protein [Aeromonas veronii]